MYIHYEARQTIFITHYHHFELNFNFNFDHCLVGLGFFCYLFTKWQTSKFTPSQNQHDGCTHQGVIYPRAVSKIFITCLIDSIWNIFYFILLPSFIKLNPYNNGVYMLGNVHSCVMLAIVFYLHLQVSYILLVWNLRSNLFFSRYSQQRRNWALMFNITETIVFKSPWQRYTRQKVQTIRHHKNGYTCSYT